VTLVLLLTSSGGPKDVAAAASASTTLTAVARTGTSRSVTIPGVVSLTATLANGKEAATSIVQSSASLTAELRSQTVRPAAECNVFLTSAAELRQGTELAASIIQSSASLTAELRSQSKPASAQSDATLSATAFPTNRAGTSVSALIASITAASGELRNGTEIAASIIQSSASLSAELRNGTELAASLVATSVSLGATLRNGTELAASVVGSTTTISALLRNPVPLRSTSTIEIASDVSIHLPGREYGSPVTSGSSRSGNGGTPVAY
jgi:hypothetical protein